MTVIFHCGMGAGAPKNSYEVKEDKAADTLFEKKDKRRQAAEDFETSAKVRALFLISQCMLEKPKTLDSPTSDEAFFRLAVLESYEKKLAVIHLMVNKLIYPKPFPEGKYGEMLKAFSTGHKDRRDDIHVAKLFLVAFLDTFESIYQEKRVQALIENWTKEPAQEQREHLYRLLKKNGKVLIPTKTDLFFAIRTKLVDLNPTARELTAYYSFVNDLNAKI